MSRKKGIEEKINISGHVPKRYFDKVSKLVELGYFSNKSEAVTLGLKSVLKSYDAKQFLIDEIKFLQKQLEDLKGDENK